METLHLATERRKALKVRSAIRMTRARLHLHLLPILSSLKYLTVNQSKELSQNLKKKIKIPKIKNADRKVCFLSTQTLKKSFESQSLKACTKH